MDTKIKLFQGDIGTTDELQEEVNRFIAGVMLKNVTMRLSVDTIIIMVEYE